MCDSYTTALEYWSRGVMACPGPTGLDISKIVVFLQNSMLNTRFAVPGLGQGVMNSEK
jgi:hypothetical protein